jgi:hypothetical protein
MGVLLVAHAELGPVVDLGPVDAGVVVAGLRHPHGGDAGADELARVLAAVHHDRHLVQVDLVAGEDDLLHRRAGHLLDRHAGVLALDVGPGQLLRRRLQRLGEQPRAAEHVGDDAQLLVLDLVEDHSGIALLGLELAQDTGQLEVDADGAPDPQELLGGTLLKASQKGS